ncbi:hypothetical protein RY27_15630, partial [Litorilinea aerophila]
MGEGVGIRDRAQGLSAIALQLETADALLERADRQDAALQQVQRWVQKALQMARHNLEEARRSVLDLRAAPLQGRTLAQAIAHLIQESALGPEVD